MLLRFKTPVNRNGWNKKITIDTENKLYSKQPFSIFQDAIKINPAAYKEMEIYLLKEGFTETYKYL